jgi:hypothetical protein
MSNLATKSAEKIWNENKHLKSWIAEKHFPWEKFWKQGRPEMGAASRALPSVGPTERA